MVHIIMAARAASMAARIVISTDAVRSGTSRDGQRVTKYGLALLDVLETSFSAKETNHGMSLRVMAPKPPKEQATCKAEAVTRVGQPARDWRAACAPLGTDNADVRQCSEVAEYRVKR